ncbi:MAG: DUF4185 domain-containing protein [Clostridia bacterium]|nr:DUF4185 domain-containing protein [Clostridia bacterium]
MKRKGYLSILAVLAVLAMITTTFSPALAEKPTEKPILTATEATEWTDLFDRRSQSERTWLGADGIYSVALDGNDAMGSATDKTNTFFIFSDTLMGTSNEEGERIIKDGMPAQSSALLTGSAANKEAISFVYGYKGMNRGSSHLFGEHKWMLDCFVVGNNLHILGFPQEDWKPKQIDMITMPIENGAPNYKQFQETENIKELWYRDGDRYLYAYGIGVTANIESAGAPDPDGYIYIYGYRDAMQEFSRKDLIVCRIKESDFPDFSKVTYWNGSSWGTKIEESAILLTDVSCEMSVTPVTEGAYKGKYIAIYTQYTRSSNIMYAIGDSLTGPFDTPVKFYHAAEHGTVGASGSGTRVVYNAKAHPHLSTPTKLLVSYNVNVEGNGVEQWTTDYHPRFVLLDLDPNGEYIPPAETTTKAPVSSSTPVTTTTPVTTSVLPPASDVPTTTENISPAPKNNTPTALFIIIPTALVIACGAIVFFHKKKTK